MGCVCVPGPILACLKRKALGASSGRKQKLSQEDPELAGWEKAPLFCSGLVKPLRPHHSWDGVSPVIVT